MDPRGARRRHARAGAAVQLLRAAHRPLMVCGGGVLYSEAGAALREFCERHGVPCAETQAGKIGAAGEPSVESRRHRRYRHRGGQRAGRRRRRGAGGGHPAAGLHHRLGDAVSSRRGSGSWRSTCSRFDAGKHGALPLVADAREGLAALERSARAVASRRPSGPLGRRSSATAGWRTAAGVHRRGRTVPLPSDAQVIGAVQRARRRPTSWWAPPAACPESCISTGRPSSPAAITSSTAIPAWATRSPARSG